MWLLVASVGRPWNRFTGSGETCVAQCVTKSPNLRWKTIGEGAMPASDVCVMHVLIQTPRLTSTRFRLVFRLQGFVHKLAGRMVLNHPSCHFRKGRVRAGKYVRGSWGDSRIPEFARIQNNLLAESVAYIVDG